MRKYLVFSILAIFLVQNICMAACPSFQEFQYKNTDFQNRALKQMQNPDINNPFALLDEQDAYYKSILPGCIQYFKTTQKPDCSRLSVLTTGYIMADKNVKEQYYTSIQNLLNVIPQSCKYQVDAAKIMLK